MHSKDALTKPETTVKICKKNNWGFAITDHNNMNAYKGSQDKNVLNLAKKNKVFCIPGEEILVIEDNKAIGEIIAYFISEPIAPSSFEEILDSVKSQGGILSCPHPFEFVRKNYKHLEKNLKYFSSIETFNARAWNPEFNKIAKKFATKHKVPGLAVSDAHTPEEIGNGLTQINAQTENEFLREIKKGRVIHARTKKSGLWPHIETQLVKKGIEKAR
jgi:predicted metal-dependent phosphoesterase TrpH